MEMDSSVAIDIITKVSTSEEINDTENVNEIGTSVVEPSTKVIASSEESKQEKEKEITKPRMVQFHRHIAKDIARLCNENPSKDMVTVLTNDTNNSFSQRPTELVKYLKELSNLFFSTFEILLEKGHQTNFQL